MNYIFVLLYRFFFCYRHCIKLRCFNHIGNPSKNRSVSCEIDANIVALVNSDIPNSIDIATSSDDQASTNAPGITDVTARAGAPTNIHPAALTLQLMLLTWPAQIHLAALTLQLMNKSTLMHPAGLTLQLVPTTKPQHLQQ